jgi:uncharacterized protein YjiS (DUF1127 family)
MSAAQPYRISLLFKSLACTHGLTALQQRLLCGAQKGPISGAGFQDVAGERASTMLAMIIRFIRAWRRSAAVKRELSHLSDRELADIGISRSDIDWIAARGARR